MLKHMYNIIRFVDTSRILVYYLKFELSFAKEILMKLSCQIYPLIPFVETGKKKWKNTSRNNMSTTIVPISDNLAQYS